MSLRNLNHEFKINAALRAKRRSEEWKDAKWAESFGRPAKDTRTTVNNLYCPLNNFFWRGGEELMTYKGDKAGMISFKMRLYRN